MPADSEITVANARVCALTNPGRVRKRNEDRVYASEDGRLLVCADGLGGLPAGDAASRIAVEAVVGHLGAVADSSIGIDAWRKRLGRAILAAEAALLSAADENRDFAGMATTLVVAVVVENQVCVSHVGDVRAYFWRSAHAEQLTADHSVVWEAVERGELTPEQARVHPSGNLVTQALGLRDRLVLRSSVKSLESGDRVLLCSDGLWETLPHERLAVLLGGGTDATGCAEGLLGHALDAGGHDNISAVVYVHR